MIAFDTETELISPGRLVPRLVCLSYADAKGRQGVLVGDDALDAAKLMLRDTELLAGANVAFDFAVLANAEPALLPLIFDKLGRGEVFDVQIAEALNAIANGHLYKDPKTYAPLKGRYSLEACVKSNLGRDDAKKNDFYRLRYGLLAHLPLDQWPEDARQYPIDDAKNTLDVALRQRETHRNLRDLPAQCRAAFALHLSACWGIRTDGEAIATLEARLLDAHTDARARFTGVFLREDGSEDTAKVKAAVAAAYDSVAACPACVSGKVPSAKTGKPVRCSACGGAGVVLSDATPRTETGGVSTSRDTLAESDNDTLVAYAKVGELDKLRESYLPFLKQSLINPRPNVLVESGRTSYNGLIQTIPRAGGVRECFVPRPGMVFCSVDYNSLELCTLAQCQLWISGRSAMGDAINDGRDLHTAFAAAMLGAEYGDTLAAVKAGEPRAVAYRQAAKPCNFGFPGGMGVATFVLANRKAGIRFCTILGDAFETCGVEKITTYKRKTIPPTCARCIEIAERLKAQWFLQWPEMRDYFQFVSNHTETNGELVQFVSERVRGSLGFCDGSNTLFQGLAADGAKAALWTVSRECYTDRASPLFGSRPVIFVHDEIFAELPEEQAPRAAQRLADIMITEMSKYVPDVRIGAEPALMRRWYKGAKPVYKEGVLIPYEP